MILALGLRYKANRTVQFVVDPEALRFLYPIASCQVLAGLSTTPIPVRFAQECNALYNLQASIQTQHSATQANLLSANHTSHALLRLIAIPDLCQLLLSTVETGTSLAKDCFMCLHEP
jgi:hypothetical protein